MIEDGEKIAVSVMTMDRVPENLEYSLSDMIEVLDESRVKYVGDGYMVAEPRVSRVGVQTYIGRELGVQDELVRVYRSPEVVFDEDSLRSYANRPVTNDHPPVPVTADNWLQYARGHTGGEVARDGRFVRVPVVLADQGVISDYKAGKKQLSLGYRMNLRWEKGTTTDGEPYDAVVTKIRANHLAVVAAARGGPELRIGDDKAKELDKMSDMKKTITVDGLPVTVLDDQSAMIVDKHVKALSSQVTDLTSKLTVAQTTLDAANKAKGDGEVKHATELKTKDAEIETLKKQVSDAAMTPVKLDQLVKDRQASVDRARAVMPSVIVDGKTDSEIRRQVVDAVMGDAANGWNDEQVSVSFSTITKDAKPVVASNAFVGTDTLASTMATSRPNGGLSVADAAYAERNKLLQDAWKQPAPAK